MAKKKVEHVTFDRLCDNKRSIPFAKINKKTGGKDNDLIKKTGGTHTKGK